MKNLKYCLLLLLLVCGCKKDKLYLDGQKAWADSTLVKYTDVGADLKENGITAKEPLTIVQSFHTALYDGFQYTVHDSNNPHLYFVLAYTQLERW